MDGRNELFYDELKVPVLVLLIAAVVWLISSIYVAAEVIDILGALAGKLGFFAQLLVYAPLAINVAMIMLLLFGLYKHKGWARGAVAFFISYLLMTFSFQSYIVFLVGVNLTAITVSMVANFIAAVLAGYALYLLASPAVIDVLGKVKLENLLLGVAIGMCLGVYEGVDEIKSAPKLVNPAAVIADIVKKSIYPRYCCARAIQSNLQVYGNYPTTTESCTVMYNDIINQCQQSASAGIPALKSSREIKYFMMVFSKCVNDETHKRVGG